MDIFSFITLFGGLAFFLYGMNVMSTGLEKIAGGKLESILKKMTSNVFKSLFLGAAITIAIQSSSALTVMLVGLVNSGIMELSGTIGVIMGSNIGTTLTAWILSLTGIESDNVFLRLLKPEAFSPIFAFVGIILLMCAKKTKKRDVGKIMIGFSVLMYGMQLMSGAVSPLADMPEFSSILTAFTNPILGVIVGALFTGVIQSSAASVGILQALSLTGSISYSMAIPIIMGQNIGTCVTALLSSIGVNKNARRVSAVHISFNIIGTIICLIAFYAANAVLKFDFVAESINPVGIAFVHSIFNIVTTAILLPFTKQLEKLAKLIVRGDSVGDSVELLDERLLATPAVAIARCKELTVEMAELASSSFLKSMDLIFNFNETVAEQIDNDENTTDMYEDKLGSYLVKISGRSLTMEDSHDASNLLHTIGDFERIGDHASGMVKAAREINEKGIVFSGDAKNEIITISKAVSEILSLTLEAFKNDDLEVAKRIEPLEQVVDKLKYKLKNMHISRLQQGECTIEMGFIFSDLLTNYSRVADHCSNVAVCLIQVADDSFDTHEYLNNMKSHGDNTFDEMYRAYKKKYNV
ncbi:MAG: Na/Pi cotransporter family protein [Clostridia bacterium]|nr:Na/Pi cotransporter family protein [Clostridia bacterium]